jgi:ABC-type transport system involved in multi-copper enzyme maturation permease subunit
MTRALIWKEWRTQRPLVLAGLAIAAALPLFLTVGMMAGSSMYRFGDLVAALTPIFALFIWPLFAAATAASAFAADRSDDSLRFLLSRPVSRGRVWLIKAGSALAAFLAVVAGTMLIRIVYTWLAAGANLGFTEVITRQVGGRIDTRMLVVAAPFALLFGCSLYCSTFARRPIAAAVGGFLVAACMIGLSGMVWWLFSVGSLRFTFSNIFYRLGASAGVPLAAIGVLIASFFAFRRGDVLGERGPGSVLRPLLVVALVVMLISAVPSVYGSMRSLASIAASQPREPALSGDTAVLMELSPNGLSTRITTLAIGADAPRRVIAEHATSPAVSPDGRWIVYISHGGYLGMLAEKIEIRAVRPDGSEDHAISNVLDWDWGYSSFSLLVAPDNDHVALVTPIRVVIASISRAVAREVDLGITENIGIVARNGDAIGWAAGESAELLFSRISSRFNLRRPAEGGSPVEWGPALRKTALLAFDPESGESRVVAELAGAQRFRRIYSSVLSYGALPQRAWAWLPAWIDDTDGSKLVLINTASGEILELGRSPCDLWGFSEDGARFVYGLCSGRLRTGDSRTEIRVRDLVADADGTFAVLEGYETGSGGRELSLAPDGERLLLYARHGYDAPRATQLVSRDGQVRALAADAFPVRWIGEDEALLRRMTGYRELQLSIVDVRTGTMRTIYP